MHTTDPNHPPDDSTLPCPQAMLAGTLALMSAWAHPAQGCQLGSGQRRPLLARKIISNLFFLQQHPLVSPALRALAGRLHQHWVAGQAGGAPADDCMPVAASHAASPHGWH